MTDSYFTVIPLLCGLILCSLIFCTSIFFSLQEGQLSYEEAIIAKQNHVHETHGRVQQLKEESEALMRQYFVQRKEEQQEMRRLVEATMAAHQSTKEAKRKLQIMKQKIGKGSSEILVLE